MGQQRADIVGKPRHQLQRIRLIRFTIDVRMKAGAKKSSSESDRTFA